MALPIVVLVILSIVALITLYLGITNFARDQGISFLMVAGVLFLVTGLFLWTGGLELTTVSYYDMSSGDKITPVYEVVTVEDAGPLWAVSNVMILGGFLTILIALGNTMGYFKLAAAQEKFEREEFF